MKKHLLKIISTLLGFLGLSSAIIACYGMPMANYRLSGTVVDKESGQPIENIQIGFDYENSQYVNDLTASDNEGKWELNEHLNDYYDTYYIYVRDKDGLENGGLYAKQEIKAELVNTGDLIYEQHNINIQMEKVTEVTYKLSGKVVNKENQPLNNILIDYNGKMAYTDKNGEWEINANMPLCESNCSIIAKDVDGNENGLYVDQEVNIAPTESSYLIFEQHGINIIMEEATE